MKCLKVLILVFIANFVFSCSSDDDSTATTGTDCTNTTDTYEIVLDPTLCMVSLTETPAFSESAAAGIRTITANSIPDHNVGVFPNANNPNTIAAISSTYTVTENPVAAASTTSLLGSNGFPAYSFGILFSGVEVDPIAAEYFEQSNGQINTDWNENALSSAINLGTDCNNAHVQPSGKYHYHATPSAYIETLAADGSAIVPVGYAADGFRIMYKYGNNSSGAIVELSPSYRLLSGERSGNGSTAPNGCFDGTYTQDYEFVSNLGDLDECNGYTDPVTSEYYYVITDTYPSLPRCFTGTPSSSFALGGP